MLLDGGDMFQGTLESNMNEGAAVVRAYNALGYDAVAVGNHEFDFGPAGPGIAPHAPGDDPRGALKARVAEARFPFLAANLIDEATGAPPSWPNLADTRLLDVAGVKIGIVGIANPWTASMTLPANFAGLRALPHAPPVVAAAKKLRRQGAAAVVVVTPRGRQLHALRRRRQSLFLRGRQRHLPARPSPAAGHRGRDRRRPHARRHRPPGRRRPNHRGV